MSANWDIFSLVFFHTAVVYYFGFTFDSWSCLPRSKDQTFVFHGIIVPTYNCVSF
jgi:hypothetical protein